MSMEALRQFFPQILIYLDFTNIYPFLISEQLLTQAELCKLKKVASDGEDNCRVEQIGLLVSILQRKGSNAYPLFYKALQRSVDFNDLNCHLGHVELLQLLPKPTSSGEEREEILVRSEGDILKFPVMEETQPPLECTSDLSRLCLSYPGSFNKRPSYNKRPLYCVPSLTYSLNSGDSLITTANHYCIPHINATSTIASIGIGVCDGAGSKYKDITDSGVLLNESCEEESIIEKDSPRFNRKTKIC